MYEVPRTIGRFDFGGGVVGGLEIHPTESPGVARGFRLCGVSGSGDGAFGHDGDQVGAVGAGAVQV